MNAHAPAATPGPRPSWAPHPATVSLARLGMVAAATIAAWMALAAVSPPAQAQQSLTVTRTDDPPPDGCAPTDCSLREAVIAANTAPAQAATINVNATTYALTIAGLDQGAQMGDLGVTSEVTIMGPASGQAVVDAGAIDHRVFRVSQGGALTLDYVTATGGTSEFGGAVLARSTAGGPVGLTVIDSRIEGNEAEGGGGIGALNSAGDVNVQIMNSRVESNTAIAGAGLLLGNSEVRSSELQGQIEATVVDSAIRDNLANRGAGIDVLAAGDFVPRLSVQSSVIAANTATDDLSEASAAEADLAGARVAGAVRLVAGGGIANEGGDVRMVNTTLSGNRAHTGGAIHNAAGQSLDGRQPAGMLELVQVTIARNEGTGTSGGSPGSEAEAVLLDSTNATARSTMIAENEPTQAGEPIGPNCVGSFTSQGQNLEDADTCGFGQSSDVVDTDPRLADLAVNAPGSTATHALPAGSPAVDHYLDGTSCDLPEDQRGVSRPQDGDASGTARCDIGAFELQGEAPGGEADVEVMKSAPGSALVGDQLDYTLTVENAGPATAADVEVTDALPAEVSFDAVSTSSGTCSQTSSDTVECDLGDLASGATVTVTITVTADTPTSAATNTGQATTTTTDAAPGDNSDTADVLISEQDFRCVPTNTADPLPEGVSRLSGPERIATAIRISQESCPDGAAGAVVLTRADIFADALSGTPLATQEDAPILFSNRDQLTAATAGELQRVLPAGGTVYLLGQTAALSNQVEADVADLGFNTIRIGGANRFGTAARIADQGLGDPDTLLLTDGVDFPDAITGASGEAVNGGVLLTAGNLMPSETQSYLNGRTGNPTLFAIGGPASNAAPSATAVVGSTRFHTSVQVADQFFSSPSAVGIATGGGFADALAGGALMGKLGGPMLLTSANDLPLPVENYLQANAASIDRAIIFGGTAVVSPSVETEVTNAITP